LTCCHSCISDVNKEELKPPFYDDELPNRTEILRFPLEAKKIPVLQFLNQINKFVHPDSAIQLTGVGFRELENLRINSQNWLRRHHVSLHKREANIYCIDPRYIGTAEPKNVDQGLLMKYSIPTLRKIFQSNYARIIQNSFRSIIIYKKYELKKSIASGTVAILTEEVMETRLQNVRLSHYDHASVRGNDAKLGIFIDGFNMLIAESALKFQMRKIMRLANGGFQIDATEAGLGPVNADFREWLSEHHLQNEIDAEIDEGEPEVILTDLQDDDDSDDDELLYNDSDDEDEEFN
jgi:hypothetical protein